MRCDYIKCQLNAEFYVVLAKPFITIGNKTSFYAVLSGKIKTLFRCLSFHLSDYGLLFSEGEVFPRLGRLCPLASDRQRAWGVVIDTNVQTFLQATANGMFFLRWQVLRPQCNLKIFTFASL